MNNTSIVHDCRHCKLKKVPIDVKCEFEDAEVFKRINTMLANADQAMDPRSLANLPETVTAEDKKLFLEIASKNKNEASALLAEWWGEMKRRYGVPDSAKFDGDGVQFYQCIDERTGIPDITGQFIPKE